MHICIDFIEIFIKDLKVFRDFGLGVAGIWRNRCWDCESFGASAVFIWLVASGIAILAVNGVIMGGIHYADTLVSEL